MTVRDFHVQKVDSDDTSVFNMPITEMVSDNFKDFNSAYKDIKTLKDQVRDSALCCGRMFPTSVAFYHFFTLSGLFVAVTAYAKYEEICHQDFHVLLAIVFTST